MSNHIGSHPTFGRKLNREIGVRLAGAERARNPKGRYGWKYRKPAAPVQVVSESALINMMMNNLSSKF